MAKFPELNWNATNMAEEFKLFRQRMELCFADHGTVDKVKQSTKIQIAVGNEGLKRINSSGLSDDDQKEPEKLWNLFEEQHKGEFSHS